MLTNRDYGDVAVDVRAACANDPNPHEEWRPVVGIPDYEVSNMGRMRSLRSGKQIRFSKCSNGYLMFSFRPTGTGRAPVCTMQRVHRCVAEAFLGVRPGMFVNHKDFDRENNDLSNLEWVTPTGNRSHAYAAGRFPRGTAKGNAKITELDAWVIFSHKWAGRNVAEISRIMGIAAPIVREVFYERSWNWLLPSHGKRPAA